MQSECMLTYKFANWTPPELNNRFLHMLQQSIEVSLIAVNGVSLEVVLQ